MTTSALALPAPPQPRLAQFSARQEEILDAIEGIILIDGFRNLRLRELTAQLGTSFATLYQIAPSKDELVVLVFERWYDATIREALGLLAKAETPTAQLESWTAWTIDGVSKMSRTFLNDVGTHTGVRSVLTTYVHYWVEVVHVILDAGIAAKEFRPVNTDLLATIWEGAAMTLADPDSVQNARLTPRQFAKDWADIVLYGIVRK